MENGIQNLGKLHKLCCRKTETHKNFIQYGQYQHRPLLLSPKCNRLEREDHSTFTLAIPQGRKTIADDFHANSFTLSILLGSNKISDDFHG